MNQGSRTVIFHLPCPEPRAWLVLKKDNQKPRVIEMQEEYPHVWSARLDLQEAEYRCRYYCGDDRRFVYCGPAHVQGSVDRGMDALVSVRCPDKKWASKRLQPWTALKSQSATFEVAY